MWGGAPLEDRLNATFDVVRDFEWFSSDHGEQVNALDERLNQNCFVGLAAKRIESGEVSYLYGRSLWEGLISLVPRAIWPDKPVFAGSPKIVSEMTGRVLSPNTSFGVGSVMELQINFGTAGVVVGFLIFGFVLRRLDRKAAMAERRKDYHKLMAYFLPAAAIIQPNGSMVEIFSGAAARRLLAGTRGDGSGFIGQGGQGHCEHRVRTTMGFAGTTSRIENSRR